MALTSAASSSREPCRKKYGVSLSSNSERAAIIPPVSSGLVPATRTVRLKPAAHNEAAMRFRTETCSATGKETVPRKVRVAPAKQAKVAGKTRPFAFFS